MSTEIEVKAGRGKFRPHNRRMLVHQDDAEKTLLSGRLIIPDSYQHKPSTGKVVDISTDSLSGIKIGDILLFGPEAGLPIKLDNKEYLLIHESEVIMIGEEGDDLTAE